MTTGQGIPRWVEAATAAAALVVLAPLLGACALAVAVGSGWPVIYRQQRVGRAGQPFTLYKFRTMRASIGAPQLSAAGDLRITRVGRLLRRTKCDELPQLWNVVRGDMSLVGPRPEAVIYVDLGAASWRTVLAVRPGLTDPVTLALRNEESLLAASGGDLELFYRRTLQPFKLRGYAAYLQRRSWRTDVKVIADTVLAIAVPGRTRALTIDDLTAPSRETS